MSFAPPQPILTPSLPFDPSSTSSTSTTMDSAAVDFRAFFPYTPNEVKHRKRTTSAQLKVLENVFKRDTKPNGALRIELATQLNMSPRGVQVWFQNRRAKEKSKAVKAAKSKGGDSSGNDDSLDLDGEEADEPSELPTDKQKDDVTRAKSGSPDSTNLPAQPHTAPAEQTAWEDSFDDHSLLAQRRGSLPINALASTYSDRSSPTIDAFDPSVRRLSVDASLARLASHPFAALARARNNAVLGPRPFMANRQRPFSRSGQHPPRISGMPYSLDVRRASLSNFRQSPQSAVSPSPSPFMPYNIPRASLPEHNLYVTSRPVMGSPIPGPLPSPNYSFGVANTPSMASASSGDSERNSPDSLQAFPYREPDQEEEDAFGHAYPHSRFGSIASVATSDSSIQTPYYTETPYEAQYDPTIRRDSCVSVGFTSLMSGLDMQESIVGPQGLEDFHHEELVYKIDNNSCADTQTYPSPTSTISPGTASPHGLNVAPTPIPISTSSELAFALQKPSTQSRSRPYEQPAELSIPSTNFSSQPLEHPVNSVESHQTAIGSTHPLVEPSGLDSYHQSYGSYHGVDNGSGVESREGFIALHNFDTPVDFYDSTGKPLVDSIAQW